jgi:cytochrome d ubiquinol oxidase subunit II
MGIDLAFVWAFLIAFAVLAYVVMDGFDLGIGILFPLFRNKRDRDTMMNTVAPVWDGNETWLVLGGGGLMAVFPLAYATVLPALYVPLIAMLLGLIFRGVAFEYRWRTTRWLPVWDWGFSVGSTVAALSQGIALGALIEGIPVVDRAYAGGWWNWLTPFSVATGISLVIGYALLGSTWLVLKTTGDLAARARDIARPATYLTLLAMGVVSLWTPLIGTHYLGRWLSFPAVIFSVLVPLLVLTCVTLVLSGLNRQNDVLPFVASLGLFLLGFIGIGISFYPFIVPPSLTIQEAAAPRASLAFLLVGAAVLIPIILAYTAYAYWVFRGKVRPGEGYH